MKQRILSLVLTICMLSTMMIAAPATVWSAETVAVSTVSELQSAHPYANSMDKTWVYTHPVAADSLKITFSSDTETEKSWDYIYILDGSGNQIGKYDGTTLAGQTMTIVGNVVKIRLTSDGSVAKNGFTVTNIEAESANKEVEYSCGENVTAILDENGTLTISGTGAMDDYESHADVPWYNVKDNIEKVVIENSVTTIGDRAFYNCGSLVSVTIPNSVATIGDSTFYHCSSLASITLPDNLTTIGDSAFYNSGLTEITIPNSVTTIGDSTFYHCSSLASITLLDNLTTIGDSAFYNSGLTEITIPNSVTTIGNSVFYNCGSLVSVTLPDSVTAIGEYAFFYCRKLSSVVIPDSVTTIGEYAFSYCGSLVSVTIPNSVTTIENFAFYDCGGLTDVHYGGNQEQWESISIGSYNTSLTNATIHYTEEIEDIKYTCGDNVTAILDENGTLTISGTGAMTDYESYTDVPWYENRYDIKKVVIENGVTAIGNNVFAYCPSVTEVTIPDSVTTMGEGAFFYCESIVTITIPDSVTTIGEYSLSYCNGLTNIVIPDSVTLIESSAFYNCENLTSVTIGNSVTAIGSCAFYGCYDLTDITIPYGVTTIKNGMFGECTKLNSITIPNSVNSIEEFAFYGCGRLADVYYGGNQEQWESISIGSYNTSLTNATIHYTEEIEGISYTCGDNVTAILDEDGTLTISGTGAMNDFLSSGEIPWYNERHNIKKVVIENGVTTIGSLAFSECDELLEVTIPDSVTTIGWRSFFNCGLTEVVIPDSVTSMGDSVFSFCSSLTKITISNCVTTIGYEAFYNCSILKEITIPNGVTTIQNRAFENCYGLTTISIPVSVTTIVNGAFSNCSRLTTVYYGGTRGQWNSISEGDYGNLYNATIYFYVAPQEYICGENLTASLNDKCVLTISGTGAMYEHFFTWEIPWHDERNNIRKVVIEEGVTQICEGAFSSFYDLIEIIVPNSVTMIGNNAFSSCYDLKDVYYYGTKEQWDAISIGSNNDDLTDATIRFVSDNGIEYICGDNVTAILDENGILTIRGTGAMDNFSSNGMPWYNEREEIQKVVVETGVTTIGNNAFYNCSSLVSVTISGSVTTIGERAFFDCDSLTEFATGSSVTTIGEAALALCYNLVNVTISDSVTMIGEEAFLNCSNLTNIQVSDNNANFSSNDGVLFDKGKTKLLLYPMGKTDTSYTIPNSVTTIVNSAFANCGNLTTITFGSNVTNIENYAFLNSYGLKNVYYNGSKEQWDSIVVGSFNNNLMQATIYINGQPIGTTKKEYDCGDNVTAVLDENGTMTVSGTGAMSVWYGNSAPWRNEQDNIKKLVIENGVTSVGNFAFSGCSSLTEIIIPNSVTMIGEEAFSSCVSLANITIPDNVTTIGHNAFSSTAYHNNSSNWENDVLYIGSCLIQAKISLNGQYSIKEGTRCIADYAFSNCESLTGVIIPDSVISIGECVFYYCSNLTNVAIGTGITEITYFAFANCHSLINVSIPNSIKAIGDHAFVGCWSLTNISISDSVTTIGDGAFSGCDSLTAIIIPDGVTTIGDETFSNCTNLADITIPNSVTTIGDRAFSGCDSLTAIIIPDSGTMIGSYAFYGCNVLTDIIIPYSVTVIGDGAFGSCGKLIQITVSNENKNFVSVDGVLFDKEKTMLLQYPVGKTAKKYVIPTGVITVGDSAFSECESLVEIIIPHSVTTIGQNAFSNCTNLADITIPKGVTTIADSAFMSCDNLNSVTLSDGVATIEKFAFSFCENLTSIIIPESVTVIDDYAFSHSDSITHVYYKGAQEQWEAISIGSNNSYLTNATIHYNYGKNVSKYEPTEDITITTTSDPSYMPENINDITIIGKGTAYGRFQILKSDGSVAKRVRVQYSVDGGSKKAVTTDDYGYAIIPIQNITKSHDYTVTFSGNGIQGSSGVIHVTVEPLHFSTGMESSIEKGVTAGAGLEAKAKFGSLEARAGVASASLEGVSKNSLSMEQDFVDNKWKLSMASKTNYSAMAEAKLGLFATVGDERFFDVSASLAEGSIGGSLGFVNGVGFEDEDFNLNDSQDVKNFAIFFLSSLVGMYQGNATAKIIAETLKAPVNHYEVGTVLSVKNGMNVGVVEIGDDNVKSGVTVGGVSGNSIWKNTNQLMADGSIKYSSGVTTESGVNLFTTNIKLSSDKAKMEGKSSQNFVKDSLNVSAERDADFNLKELSFSSKGSNENSSFLYKKVETDTDTITYKGNAAQTVAASYDKLEDFTTGDKAIFSKKQLQTALTAMVDSNESATYSKSKGVEEELAMDLSAEFGLGIKLGGGYGIAGSANYQYEAESGIYENGTYYQQAVNDIGADVDAMVITFEDILNSAKSGIQTVLDSIFESVKGFVDDVVEFGEATLKKVGNAITGLRAKITKSKNKTKAMSILTVEDEISLFSTSSLATTIGEPYIITIEDENGNEINDFSEQPLLLTLKYTTEQLENAGVTDPSAIAVVRWDDSKGAYVNLGGTLDTLNACVTLEITKPGQYLLAVDNCPPAITQFVATEGGNPEIRAIVSDMSGITDFRFSIDETTLLDHSNYEDKYNHTTGEFFYVTEGLLAGEHTATIYVKDSFGNELTENVTFTVDTALSQIINVTKIPEIISEEITVSAEVSDANLVLLNVEVSDVHGKTVQYSVDMSEENGVYTAMLPEVENGSSVDVWVSAYTQSGNSSTSEKQKAVVMKTTGMDPVIAITKIQENNVQVKCVGFDSNENQTVYLGLYDQDGKLLQIQSAVLEKDVTFNDVSCSGYVRAFVWKHAKPICKATKFVAFEPVTENENN